MFVGHFISYSVEIFFMLQLVWNFGSSFVLSMASVLVRDFVGNCTEVHGRQWKSAIKFSIFVGNCLPRTAVKWVIMIIVISRLNGRFILIACLPIQIHCKFRSIILNTSPENLLEIISADLVDMLYVEFDANSNRLECR